jgi:hypothetical protein
MALNSFMMKDSILDQNNTPGSKVDHESGEKLQDMNDSMNETMAYDFDDSMASVRSSNSPATSPGRKEG